ncbi:MAG: uncharacterized protein QG579_288 [Patescibacteria group bacterium]|jgi:SET domain-containing protein|nr:uncharacterized protein [Patescibacteria group bacterium]
MKKNKYTVGNFALRVGKSGTGKGLFAVDTIPKGSCIIEYTGTPVEEKDHYTNNSKYLFWVDKNVMINGNVPSNKARYINHSCRPNCEADGPKGHIFIFSKRNIKPGEELTYNYGKEYFNVHIKPKGCRCVKCEELNKNTL